MNETYKNYIIIALLAIVTAVGWILFGNIRDNRATIQSVRTELDSIGKSQQRVIGQLGTISEGISKSVIRTEIVERTVESIADRNADSKERIDRSKQIIADSKSILESLRATGKETEKK